MELLQPCAGALQVVGADVGSSRRSVSKNSWRAWASLCRPREEAQNPRRAWWMLHDEEVMQAERSAGGSWLVGRPLVGERDRRRLAQPLSQPLGEGQKALSAACASPSVPLRSPPRRPFFPTLALLLCPFTARPLLCSSHPHSPADSVAIKLHLVSFRSARTLAALISLPFATHTAPRARPTSASSRRPAISNSTSPSPLPIAVRARCRVDALS